MQRVCDFFNNAARLSRDPAQASFNANIHSLSVAFEFDHKLMWSPVAEALFPDRAEFFAFEPFNFTELLLFNTIEMTSLLFLSDDFFEDFLTVFEFELLSLFEQVLVVRLVVIVEIPLFDDELEDRLLFQSMVAMSTKLILYANEPIDEPVNEKFEAFLKHVK